MNEYEEKEFGLMGGGVPNKIGTVYQSNSECDFELDKSWGKVCLMCIPLGEVA